MFLVVCGNCGLQVEKHQGGYVEDGSIDLRSVIKKKDVELVCCNCGNRVKLRQGAPRYSLLGFNDY